MPQNAPNPPFSEESMDPGLRAKLLPLLENWRPPERLSLSEWSERNIVLSSEYAARSTQLSLFGWQKEIFDTFTDPRVEETVMCVAVQLVKTLLLQCAMAYVICCDPGPILLVEYKEQDCTDFSKERLAPMIRDCSCLKGKIVEGRGQTGNTLVAKDFPGGNLSIVSSISPGNLARRTIRYLFCDEIDRYPESSGKEGDAIDLASERQGTFQSRKKRIVCCSPTVFGKSRIGKRYRNSDQRKPWVRCPTCGTAQLLRFRKTGKAGETDQGPVGYVWFNSRLPLEEQPKSAQYICANRDCPRSKEGNGWSDVERWVACEKLEWRADKPFAGIAGFWISHLYSPWKKLSEIVAHFLKAQHDTTALQVFVNTVLAEEWQDEAEVTDPEVLFRRREFYPMGQDAVIPKGGLFLTAAVDVQESPPRLEVEVVAWGRGRENWSIDYQVLQVFAENGQPLPVTSPELWDRLDREILQRSYAHSSGHTLPILAMAIDTGRRPKPVYEFAKRHYQLAYSPTGIKLHAPRTVVPIKGNDDAYKILAGVSKEDAARQRQGVRIVTIGTVCVKGEIYDALRHIRPDPSGLPVPGCYHHPDYSMEYFQGLCAEVRVISDTGKISYEQRDKRNEAIDLKGYNRAMASIVGIDRFTESAWQQMERALGAEPVRVAPATEAQAQAVQAQVQAQVQPQPQPRPQPQPQSGRPIRGGFLD